MKDDAFRDVEDILKLVKEKYMLDIMLGTVKLFEGVYMSKSH